MRYSDVNEGSIYNVDFDPVRVCEFDRIHLALVLKKNIDMKTAIVLPLTSSANGSSVNKINLGQLECLPDSLKNVDTYAVYNQVRTVNVDRFRKIKEYDIHGNSVAVDCKLKKEQFDLVLKLAIGELCFSYSTDEKMKIYLSLYNQEKMKKCISLAYEIKKLNNGNEKTIKLQELGNLLNGFEYELLHADLNNGVQNIFENALKTLDKTESVA